MDRIQPLRIYVRVAELKSFTKAAESLGLPKASVSSHIQQLETELGTRLFQRTTRSVQLTHDGITFYESCKDMLADFDELGSMFQKDALNLTGRIRVDMPSRMARFQVLPRLHEFLAIHPQVEVELGSTDREVDLIHEGYDCVVRVGNLEDSSLIAKKITEMRIVNLVSKSYIEKYGRPKSLADLENHLLVYYVSTFGEKAEGFEYHDGTQYQVKAMKGLITVNNAEAYNAACLGGLGIIQAPIAKLQTHLLNHLLDENLVEVLPKLQAEPMPVYLVYPNQRNLTKRVKVFMNWLEEILKNPI